MNKFSAMISILLLIGMVSAVPPVCSKHTVDGNLADWGLDLTGDWSQNATWLPNAGIQFTVEDNYNPSMAGPNHPGGVHIKGIGSSYVTYAEPKVMHKDGYLVEEPFGHENFDLEAFYLDEDSDCIYVAVVTSEPPTALGDAAPADLAMNLDRNLGTGEYGYEYGVKLGTKTGLTQFGLYSTPDWSVPGYVPDNRPDLILSGQYIGQVIGAYVNAGIQDRSYDNYVIELAIPKSMIGQAGLTAPVANNVALAQGQFHLTENCGNDHIPAPEFPFILVPLAITAIAPVLGYYISKRQSK
jgi:hypothetical protein